MQTLEEEYRQVNEACRQITIDILQIVQLEIANSTKPVPRATVRSRLSQMFSSVGRLEPDDVAVGTRWYRGVQTVEFHKPHCWHVSIQIHFRWDNDLVGNFSGVRVESNVGLPVGGAPDCLAWFLHKALLVGCLAGAVVATAHSGQQGQP